MNVNNIKRWLYTMIIVGLTLTGISLIVRPEGVIPKNIYDWVASSALGGIGIGVMLVGWILLRLVIDEQLRSLKRK